MCDNSKNAPLVFLYRNYKAEVALRRTFPMGVRYGPSEYHPGDQWLMDAYDLDKGAMRTFALKDVLAFAGRPGHSRALVLLEAEDLLEKAGLTVDSNSDNDGNHVIEIEEGLLAWSRVLLGVDTWFFESVLGEVKLGEPGLLDPVLLAGLVLQARQEFLRRLEAAKMRL